MTKKNHYLMGIALAIGILFMELIAFPHKVYAEYNQDVSTGVVPIVFYTESGRVVVVDLDTYDIVDNLGSYSGALSGGTGFFVGNTKENPQYIVTNNHVVEDYVDAGEGGQYQILLDYYHPEEYGYRYASALMTDDCQLRVYYSESDYDIAYVAAHGDTGKVDLAVLRLGSPTEKRHALQLKIPTEQMVGATVYTVGFPGNADNELSNASKYGVGDVTVHKGSINRFVANTGVGVERIAIDAVIQHGNSGGPLVTDEGYVIGVNTNGVTDTENLEQDYYAINTSELARFLDKESIAYETADGSGTLSGLLPLIIGIVAAVVVIILVVVIVKKNSSKKQSFSSTQAPVSVSAATQTTAPAPQKYALLRAMSTQHNGMTFAVHATPIMIGRDPASCKVVFREGTAGVSGKHCTISYDETSGDFLLTDLRSSYGTFLMNGQRLNANVPYHLRPGDTFYVGDSANTFRVELG